MYSKFKILKFGHISLTDLEYSRLLRFRSFVFHLITLLWHIFLTYHTAKGAITILVYRQDLVNKTFGLGAQYITVWNQIIQQTYFNACLLQDILEFTPQHRYVKIKEYLKRNIPYTFASFVFPLSFLVFINFWPIYSVYPEIIDEDNVTATFFPNWVNHGLHSTIILLVCIEKFVVHRSYPTKLWGFAGLCSVLLSYTALCALFYFLSGLWPYPLFRVMNNIQRLSYVVSNILLGYFFIVMGEAVNKRIWGKRPVQTVELEKKVS